jgi:transcriptional regulator with XRE-family HTH domain
MYGSFGRLIDDILEEKQMTQKDLAKRIGKSQQGMSQLKKTKRPHYRTVVKLARALEVDEIRFLSILN